MLKAIYQQDINGVIGVQTIDKITGKVRFSQPISSAVDRKHFFQNTKDKIIIMGANTFRSLVDGGISLLPGRQHWVLTRDQDRFLRELQFKGVAVDQLRAITIFDDVTDLMIAVAAREDDELWCIGGSEIIQLLEPVIDSHVVTEFDSSEISVPENHEIIKVISVPKLGSCRNGWVLDGVTRSDCKKFEDPELGLTGFFAEYTTA